MPARLRGPGRHQPPQGTLRGPGASVISFVWDAMSVVRRLALNILFFGLLLILLIAMASAGRVKPLLDETRLVIAPEGMLVEQYSIDPGMRALSALSGTGLHEVHPRARLRALDQADRKSDMMGKRSSVRGALGGRRTIKKNNKK